MRAFVVGLTGQVIRSHSMVGMRHDTEHTQGDPTIAFFDVDNTLLRGASIYHFGQGAFRQGLLTVRDLVVFGWQQVRFIAVGENPRHLIRVRERALELAGGITEVELARLADDVYDHYIAPKLWPATVQLTAEHLARGHQVWLITATPAVIARVIADRLGLTGALGTEIEIVDGALTGRLSGKILHGEHKAEAARALAMRVGARLENCWAYSDSRNDIPLLNLVGHRVVVNPDAALARYARERGWSQMKLRVSSIRAARRSDRAQSRKPKTSG